MPNFKPELSIIIVNYRSEQYLKSCVASLFNNLGIKTNFEVIVVNNDENFSIADSFGELPEVRLIDHQKNIGFGAANNIGAKVASGEYLLLLNPDTQIQSDEIFKILDRFKANEKIGIIGPRLVTTAGETQMWCAGKELTLGQFIKNNLGISDSKKVWESKNDVLTDWVSGAALAVRKEVFNKVDGFDEKFFMYYEDMDLCGRVRLLGYEVLYCPEVSILHNGGKSRRNIFLQKIQFFKSMLYYIKKRVK
jgi:GT2 family glycosyltransferase